jgi:predicted pyridoxine 5'-phosphate oxidase superfamily flavin-nucleotide-binding protein
MTQPVSDIAFTPTVKSIQVARGSRATYARQEAQGGFRCAIDQRLRAFLQQVDTAFLATSNREGQPYAQHRGGPKGFIRALDDKTLGFVDYIGNRQYITAGNLEDNPKAFLFLMDYAHRRRIKLWGKARMIAPNVDLMAQLMPNDYPAAPEHVLLFDVDAWDVNCPQHIPQKLDLDEVAAAIGQFEARIAELEAENKRLQQQLKTNGLTS